MDPAGRSTIDRFAGVQSVRGRDPFAQQDKCPIRIKPVRYAFDPLQSDTVLPGRQRTFVSQADLGQDEPESGGHMVAHVGDPAVEARCRIQHHCDEVRGEFDVDVVEI
jgi:hypothetical protein